MSQPKASCNTAGVTFNPAQPGQQINWQQPSNIQLAPVPHQTQNVQQSGSSQVRQQNQNPLTDIFSVLQNLRFSSQKPANPTQTSSYQAPPPPNQPGQASNNAQNLQYTNQVPQSPKPSFTFEFVPVPPQKMAPESQIMQNSVPVQFLVNGQSQMASQTGQSYNTQNQPMHGSQQVSSAQSSLTSSSQGQPIVFTVNSQQPAGQNQPMVYTLQPAQPSSRSGNQQKSPQSTQPNIASDNPMALLMSQLQSPANPDMASLLPMLMSSKQEKSGGMKALLPLILNLLTDKGCDNKCGCPHCGCPYNNVEPTINGGYSNQVNYSQQGVTDVGNIVATSLQNVEETSQKEDVKEKKKYKTNEISDFSEEASDEDEEYEYDDD